MSTVTPNEIRELRRRTQAGIMDCRAVLQQTNGDVEAAAALLRERGIAEAPKREQRRANEGLVGSYVHHTGKLAALVEVSCETDFVARTEPFTTLVRQLAEQVAAAAALAVDRASVPREVVDERRQTFERETRALGKPEALVGRIVEGRLEAFYREVALLEQPWIREPKTPIAELVASTGAVLGERVVVRRFARFVVGETNA